MRVGERMMGKREFWILEDAKRKCATTVASSLAMANERKLFDDNIFHVIEIEALRELEEKVEKLKLICAELVKIAEEASPGFQDRLDAIMKRYEDMS
jgi:hypothetical protein